jgi:MFS family permease
MLLLAGSSFLLYWCSTPLQMAGIYLLFGVGLSAFSPTLMSYVADVTPPEMLGQAYGLYTMALYGGMTLGPAAGGLLGTALGLRPVFLVAGGLIFAMFFVALAFLPAQPAGYSGGGPRLSILPALKNFRRNRQLMACLVATSGGCLGFGMFVTFMPLYILGLMGATRRLDHYDASTGWFPLFALAGVGVAGEAAGLGGDQAGTLHAVPLDLGRAHLQRLDGALDGGFRQPAARRYALAQADDARERIDDLEAAP